MVNEDQMKILKLMNLSESKACIGSAESQFNSVRHALDDIMGLLASSEELSTETNEEYRQLETEIFHITKFIEKLGFDVRSKRRKVENTLFNQIGDKN